MEDDKFLEKYLDDNDEYGFNEVLYARRAKMKTLRQRLYQYRLTDEEIDKLFEVITKAEFQMEKVKKRINPKKYSLDDLIKMREELKKIQYAMKDEFESKLSKMIKDKYMKAKKIVEERRKKSES